MIYLEPINLKQWDMFRKVTGPGYTEPFLATKAMKPGDMVLFHVGQQDRRYESGVYGYGTVTTEPFIMKDHPEDYCNGKNTVMIRFDRLDYTRPIIPHASCKEFSGQFRTVHMIDPEFENLVSSWLDKA